MKSWIGVIFLQGAVIAAAEENAGIPPSEIRAQNKLAVESQNHAVDQLTVPTDTVLADIHLIEKDVRDFQSSLETQKLTPEQRAIQIEQFHQINKETLRYLETLKKQTVKNRATSQPAESVTIPDQNVPSDPVLAEIHEIENDVLDFRKSLDVQKPTPEERAIQVEQFHQLNQETLRHLKTLKKQAATQSLARNIPKAEEPAAAIPAETAILKAEIDRVMHELSQVDPETRAVYLETHAETLAVMGEELLRSITASTNPPSNQKKSDNP